MARVVPWVWLDGRLGPPESLAVRIDDSALLEGRGCYTTARVRRGCARHAGRHVRRLQRDAERIGFGALDPGLCERALKELAEAAFARSEGILRLQVSRDATGALHLLGTTRPLGPDPPTWQGIAAPFPHEGPSPFAGAKLTGRPRLARAAELASHAGADEALLFDREERLVEGARSNLFVVTEQGELVTPPLERGAVAGVARELVLERIDAPRERDVCAEELQRAREIVCVNAVRGARSLVRFEGRAVGDGQPGEWAPRFARVLEAD